MNNKTYRVLHIDDDEPIRNFVRDVLPLVLPEFKFTARDNGKEGLETALNEEFDLVICDGTLPGGFHGTDILFQAHQKYPLEKTILASGDSELFTPEGITKYQMRCPPGTKIIVKPFDVDTLISTVKDLFVI